MNAAAGRLPQRGGRPDGVSTLPPSSNTGAEDTSTLSMHWLRGVSWSVLDSVLSRLAGELSESVVILDGGRNGYTSGFLVGPVRVYANDDRPDMGVMVDVPGSACDELGSQRVAQLVRDLDLRVSRLDLAWDGFPVSPADVRDAWRRDDVRTRCKVPETALEERPWRTSDWRSNHQGDTFSMGARSSTQYARVYDRRGSVRFELEVKGALAAAAGPGVLEAIAAGDSARFADLALGLARRFVDFVDADSDTNRARATLLPWWASFVGAARKARVSLGATVVRTVEQIEAWVRHQVAPALAVLSASHGPGLLSQIAQEGRRRWTGRHLAALRLASPGTLAGTA